MRENRNRRFVATIQPIAHEKLYPIHSPLLEKQKGAFAFRGSRKIRFSRSETEMKRIPDLQDIKEFIAIMLILLAVDTTILQQRDRL